MKFWTLAGWTLIFALSCSGNKLVKVEEKRDITVVPAKIFYLDSLQVARSYIDLGKNAEIEGDSLGADEYFQSAIDISSGIQRDFDLTGDTLGHQLVEDITGVFKISGSGKWSGKGQ